MQNVLEANTPSISMIKKECGELFQKSFMVTWVLYLNEILTLKRPLSESQIDIVCDLIISEYSNLKIADITFIFKNAISGKYGEFYESLTVPKIMSWFALHFEERCEIAEHISTLSHFNFNENFNEKWNSKIIKELFKDIPNEIPKEPKTKIELPEVLNSSDGYIKQLTKSVKSLSKEDLEVMIDYWGKYPKYKIYQDVYKKEIESR